MCAQSRGIIKQTAAGCMNCNVYLCIGHFRQFRHNPSVNHNLLYDTLIIRKNELEATAATGVQWPLVYTGWCEDCRKDNYFGYDITRSEDTEKRVQLYCKLPHEKGIKKARLACSVVSGDSEYFLTRKRKNCSCIINCEH